MRSSHWHQLWAGSHGGLRAAVGGLRVPEQLKINMPLQADPTVRYVMTEDRSRVLYRDLRSIPLTTRIETMAAARPHC